MSVMEYEVGRQPGPPTRNRIEVDPITLRVLGGAFHAIAKEMAGVLFRMSYSSIIRESEDLGAGIFDAEGRELCESDSTPMHIGSLPWYIRGFMHTLEGRGRGGRRHRPQPPVPRRIAHARRGRRRPHLLGGRAPRLRRRDGARAGCRRLVPRHQRRRLRRLRRVEALQRPALVPTRRAERGSRPDDLRERPHGDDEPRRHERDARRLPARVRALPAAGSALRRGDRDERRLRLDGLLRAHAPRARSRRSPTASTRRRPAGSTTTPATAESACGWRRPSASRATRSRSTSPARTRRSRPATTSLTRARCSWARTTPCARSCSTRTSSPSTCRRTTASSGR